MPEKSTLIHSAKRTIEMERDAVSALLPTIGDDFAKACEILLNCSSRVVVTGMGKSGHIGRKIAATLASTGTPALFVHPGEASHGDMGMIIKEDVVLALSNSGNTNELVTLLPLIKRINVPLISMTSDKNSSLGSAANVHIEVRVETEACPLDLAPTSSTTAALVMGDALAIALLEARGFTAEDFAFSHPGGALGKKLLLKVEDIMHTGDDVPIVADDVLLPKALMEITSKGLGMTCIVDNNGASVGIFTDGDLRRTLDKDIDLRKTPIREVMTKDPKTVKGHALAAEALGFMEDKKISGIFIVDENDKPIGAVNMHDFLTAGVV